MPGSIGIGLGNEYERWKRLNAPQRTPQQYVPRFSRLRDVNTRDRWGDYQPYVDKIMGMYQDAFNAPGVNFNVGNAGLGQYNWGETPDLGDTGLGEYQMGNAGQGQSQVNQYSVDPQLMGFLTGRMTNPETAMETGRLRDVMSGQSLAAQQAMNNQLASTGIRGGAGGVGNAMRMQMQNEANKQLADQQRQALLAIQQNAISNRMGAESMNLDSLLQSQGQRLGAEENSFRRALEGAGMQGQFFENARQREQALANAQAGLEMANREGRMSAYEQARQRELGNAGLGLEAANAQRNWMMSLIGGQAGILGDISNFLSGARAQDFAEGQYNNEVMGMNDINANTVGAASWANKIAAEQDQEAIDRFNWQYPGRATVGGRWGGRGGGTIRGGGFGGFGGGTGSWASRFGRGWGR